MGATDADPEMGAFLELRNAWGNQPMIWDALVKKYGKEFGATGFSFEDWGKLMKWVYLPSSKMEPFELNVYAMADEGNYIEGAEDMLLYAQSLRKFTAVHENREQICHLLAAAGRIEQLVSEKQVRWLAWYGTSVNANPWQVQDPDDEDERKPYNMVKDLGKPLFDSGAVVEQMKMLPLEHEPAPYSAVRTGLPARA